jgi:hypothetical protein
VRLLNNKFKEFNALNMSKLDEKYKISEFLPNLAHFPYSILTQR